jgi:hypothetical protein
MGSETTYTEVTPESCRRGHKNNLVHAREVYLCILRSVPKDMILDELEVVTHEVTDMVRGRV